MLATHALAAYRSANPIAGFSIEALATLVAAEQAHASGSGTIETFDEDYVTRLGVADRLSSWK